MSYIDQGRNFNVTYPYPVNGESMNNMRTVNGTTGNRNNQYLNDLKSQMVEQNKRPNKLQMYREKMVEREELEKNFAYNPFGKEGNGAPLKDRNGNLVTTRKGIENNLFKENYGNAVNMNSGMNSGMNMNMNVPNNYNGNNHLQNFNPLMNNMPIQDQQARFYNNINKNEPAFRYDMNPYYDFRSNQSESLNSYMNNFTTGTNNSNIKQNQYNVPKNSTTPYAPQQALPSPNKYTPNQNPSLNILPSQPVQDETNVKVINYQNDLLKQIDEKKFKKEDQKRREAELERLEEEKYNKYLQMKKEQEEQMKMKKKSRYTTQPEEESSSNNANYVNNVNNNIIQEELKIEKTKEMIYPRDRQFEIKMKERDDKELQSFKEAIGMTYENLNRTIKEDTNQQIIKLKSEVNRQYSEINEIFNKLRMDVSEASQLKFEAERELNKLKEEIERKKVTNLLYEEKLNCVLDKHAPYNNLHIPIEEVHPLFNRPTKGKRLNLKSTSTMVYSKEEYMEEKNDLNGLNDLSGLKPNQGNLSSLAKRGQNLMGDSEFVPIVPPLKRNKIETDRDLLSPSIESDNNPFNETPEGNYTEMYMKLNEITQLNSQLDATVKYKTINKDFDLQNKLDNFEY